MNGDSAKWVIDSFDPTSWMQCPNMDFPKMEGMMMETMIAQLICVVEILLSTMIVVGAIWGMMQ